MKTIEEPFLDLVIVIPGILGTQLLMDGKVEWGLSTHTISANLLSLGAHLEAKLAIPRDGDPAQGGRGEVSVGKVIKGIAAIPGIGGIDFYSNLERNLSRHLKLSEGQLAWFGYDWRLSCRVTGAQLARFVEIRLAAWRKHTKKRHVRAVFVAHSMGGLVAQWASASLAGSDYIRHIITLGTPFKGSPEALLAVTGGGLLSRAPALRRFAMTLPSLYELLPQYHCIKATSRPGEVTGYENSATYLEQALSESPHQIDLLNAATAFRADLQLAESADPTNLTCFRSTAHRTLTYLQARRGRLEPLRETSAVPSVGDGVVPADSAIPQSWGRPHFAKFASQRHSSLGSSAEVGPELEAILQHSGRLMAARPVISISCPNAIHVGDTFSLSCDVMGQSGTRVRPPLALTIVEMSKAGLRMTVEIPRVATGYEVHLSDLPSAFYRWTVSGPPHRTDTPPPVNDYLVVARGTV